MSAGLPGLPRGAFGATLAFDELNRKVADLATSTTRQGDAVTVTGKNTNIGTTNILTAARNGIYRATIIVQTTTADGLSAATVAGTIGWTSRAKAETSSTTGLAAAALGDVSKTVEMQVQGGTAITYAATITGAILTGIYALEVRVERIG